MKMFDLTLISYLKGNKKCCIQYGTEITLAQSRVKLILILYENASGAWFQFFQLTFRT